MGGCETIGLIVFAHGSRVEGANEAVRAVATEAAKRSGIARYRAAFLELAPPSLSEAARDLASEGVREILITPYFLTMGRHLTVDLPRLVRELRPVLPDIRIRTSPPLDGHPDLAGILASRARGLLGNTS